MLPKRCSPWRETALPMRTCFIMALRDSLSVPEFILYFTAVSTFTTWVMGILQAAQKLHEESLDLSQVREFLEYPEPFRFEGGAAIPKADAYELKLEHVSFRYPGAGGGYHPRP